MNDQTGCLLSIKAVNLTYIQVKIHKEKFQKFHYQDAEGLLLQY